MQDEGIEPDGLIRCERCDCTLLEEDAVVLLDGDRLCEGCADDEECECMDIECPVCDPCAEADQRVKAGGGGVFKKEYMQIEALPDGVAARVHWPDGGHTDLMDPIDDPPRVMTVEQRKALLERPLKKGTLIFGTPYTRDPPGPWRGLEEEPGFCILMAELTDDGWSFPQCTGRDPTCAFDHGFGCDHHAGTYVSAIAIARQRGYA